MNQFYNISEISSIIHINCECKFLFVTVTMAADLKQPPLSFVVLSYVFLTTHFNDDGNKIFNYKHKGCSLLFGNIFIIDEHNDDAHKIPN